MYSEQCTVNSVQWTVYIEQCTVDSRQLTVYIEEEAGGRRPGMAIDYLCKYESSSSNKFIRSVVWVVEVVEVVEV